MIPWQQRYHVQQQRADNDITLKNWSPHWTHHWAIPSTSRSCHRLWCPSTSWATSFSSIFGGIPLHTPKRNRNTTFLSSRPSFQKVLYTLLDLLLRTFVDCQILSKTSKAAIQISSQDFASGCCILLLSCCWNIIISSYSGRHQHHAQTVKT